MLFAQPFIQNIADGFRRLVRRIFVTVRKGVRTGTNQGAQEAAKNISLLSTKQ
jgi:hypothetical protein